MIDDDRSMERNDGGGGAAKVRRWLDSHEHQPLLDLTIRTLLARRGLWGLGLGLHVYHPGLLGQPAPPDESGITSPDQLMRLAYAEPWEAYRNGGRARAAARVSRFSAMVRHGVDPNVAESQLLREAGAPIGGAP